MICSKMVKGTVRGFGSINLVDLISIKSLRGNNSYQTE